VESADFTIHWNTPHPGLPRYEVFIAWNLRLKSSPKTLLSCHRLRILMNDISSYYVTSKSGDILIWSPFIRDGAWSLKQFLTTSNILTNTHCASFFARII
ncbi:unnamed protein product, partial [Owenia fusiformis]